MPAIPFLRRQKANRICFAHPAAITEPDIISRRRLTNSRRLSAHHPDLTPIASPKELFLPIAVIEIHSGQPTSTTIFRRRWRRRRLGHGQEVVRLPIHGAQSVTRIFLDATLQVLAMRVRGVSFREISAIHVGARIYAGFATRCRPTWCRHSCHAAFFLLAGAAGPTQATATRQEFLDATAYDVSRCTLPASH